MSLTTTFATAFGAVRRSLAARACAGSAILASIATLLTVGASAPVEAKTPGSTYCFYGRCHRVKTIAETRKLVGKQLPLHASHYDDCGTDRYNPCGLTSSGERFYPKRADNAASPIYPDGTILLTWHKGTGNAVVVRINNAGPYWGNRKLDLSIAAAKQLGFAHRGVAKLQTMVLAAPTRAQARYKKHRRYKRVLGHIGRFKTFDQAHRTAAAIMAVEAIAGSSTGIIAGAVVSASRNETIKVASNRARTRGLEEAITAEMFEPETRWPDFAHPVGAPQLRPIRSANRVAARRLPPLRINRETRVAQRSNVKLRANRVAAASGSHRPIRYRSAQTAIASAAAPTTVETRPASTDAPKRVLEDAWLRPARASVELVKATDVGAADTPLWRTAGRLKRALPVISNGKIAARQAAYNRHGTINRWKTSSIVPPFKPEGAQPVAIGRGRAGRLA